MFNFGSQIVQYYNNIIIRYCTKTLRLFGILPSTVAYTDPECRKQMKMANKYYIIIVQQDQCCYSSRLMLLDGLFNFIVNL